MIMLTTAPTLVGLISFGTYVLIDKSNQLNATKVFVTISYINKLRLPLTVLPNVAISFSTDYLNKKPLPKIILSHFISCKLKSYCAPFEVALRSF